VKLAAASPSSSKLSTAKAFPSRPPVVPFDSAAYTNDLGEYDSNDDEWEDVRSEVDYPVLPVGDEVDYPVLQAGNAGASSLVEKRSQVFVYRKGQIARSS
jgi:hypothetical protein